MSRICAIITFQAQLTTVSSGSCQNQRMMVIYLIIYVIFTTYDYKSLKIRVRIIPDSDK